MCIFINVLFLLLVQCCIMQGDYSDMFDQIQALQKNMLIEGLTTVSI